MKEIASNQCAYCGGSGRIVSPFGHEFYPCPECRRPAAMSHAAFISEARGRAVAMLDSVGQRRAILDGDCDVGDLLHLASATLREANVVAADAIAMAERLIRAESEMARLGQLVELHTGLARTAQNQASNALGEIDELCAEMDEIKEVHAREREGLLGDKTHLNQELDAATELIVGLRRQWDRFEPLLRAYHAGADRDQLKAACVERWGEPTSVKAGELRWLNEPEGNQ